MTSPPTRSFGRLGLANSPDTSSPSSQSPRSTTATPNEPPSLARLLWQRRVSLLITHAALLEPQRGKEGEKNSEPNEDPSTTATSTTTTSTSHPQQASPVWFAASVPRFGYLAQLLPRLTAFFGRPCSSFHYEDVPLRNLPVGLLADLYRPSSSSSLSAENPAWRLVVDDGDAWHLADTFLNGTKEADYVRYGSAKQVLSLSKADTEALWDAVQDNDYGAFARVNNKLLNAPVPLKHIPLRLYIPSSPPSSSSSSPSETPPAGTPPAASGSYKVMQALVPPRTSNRQPQTLGPALRNLLPLLFPSSRDPVLANVVLHGAPVPFRAPLEDLMREAAYPDGWLCLIVVLL